jgi:transcriptional regulator
MYVPPKFSVEQEAAWTIVKEAGAGLLVAKGPGGMQSVFVPVVVNEDRTMLTSHVAKANNWWKALRDGDEVLAVFLAASAYVSPSNYPSRFENPGVVPTWNFVMAEVRGTVKIHADAEWLKIQTTSVTEEFERERNPEWLVSEIPNEYYDQQLKAIIGLEITVSGIQGKAKLSQNRPEIDHDSVRDNFAQGTLSEQNVSSRMNLDK